MNGKKFADLIKTMVEVLEMIDRLKLSLADKSEEQAIIDLNRLKAERAIEKIVGCITKD